MELAVRRMEAQLVRWSLKIDQLAVGTLTAGVLVPFDALISIDELRGLHAIAQSRLDGFKAAPPGDTQREEVQAELMGAWNDLVAALRSKNSGVRGRYRRARRIAPSVDSTNDTSQKPRAGATPPDGFGK